MRGWPVLLAGLWLVGCAAPQPDVGEPQTREERREQLDQLESWHLKGRVAIINGSEAWHLNVDWRQRADDYRIQLWGPFGSGRVQLDGDQYGVRLSESNQQTYYARDPESLLYEHTGVKMPVSGLRYWILGQSDPRLGRQQLQRDEAGRPTALQQDDWQVRFKRYTRIDGSGLALPDRLSVDKDDLQVKLVVDHWQVNDRAP